MTTDEAREALRRASVAILPIGATEQHGPHLELRTDTALASALAAELAAGLGDRAVVLPEIGYGLSEHHLPFAGTLTLRPTTLRAVLLDILESIRHHGIDKVLIVNGHGGNIDAIRLVAREALRDFGMQVAHLMWAQLARDAIADEAGPSWRRNHACEIETSLAMVLDESLLRPDRIGESHLIGAKDDFTEPTNASVDLPIWFDAWTETGALGDPRRASAQRGERIAAEASANALAFALQFLEGRPRSRPENPRTPTHASRPRP
ncbi:creatininase family protein [Sinomonas sp. JGH33]|uniref:Creatininase family protein n=1 Tax=Sinomonas terricola TaxID=3110330 RepID=A0ABU5TC72_9MICC|nr:creatininase family protein [Sinomonas sp. JGH33]MEA5457273.1 creatininase family protein [Sinomonas sp. JGH33]